MERDYPWYEFVNGSEAIRQGDFLLDCPIIIPPLEMRETETPEVDVDCYNVIVMSQSCDLENKKIDLVLVCPVWPLEKFAGKSPSFNNAGGKEKLRRGEVVGYHLLNKCELDGLKKDFQVVDFRNVYSVNFTFLVQFAEKQGQRLCLLPPYREHLSQAFARFFMRVGLPMDIPKFS